jgi:hypothetical protein
MVEALPALHHKAFIEKRFAAVPPPARRFIDRRRLTADMVLSPVFSSRSRLVSAGEATAEFREKIRLLDYA